MDKLSIIIPVYNGEKYISSLLNDLIQIDTIIAEIIVVNDGSTDNTLELLKKYAGKHNAIKVLSQEKSGPSKARNNGLSVATGKYITFCDADDRVDVKKFKNFYLEAIASMAQYCFSGYIDHHIKTEKNSITSPKGSGIFSFEDFQNIFFENLSNKTISYIFNKIYLKPVLDEHQIRFEEQVHYAEDLLFNLKYLQHVKTIYVSQTSYYLYQRGINEDSLSSKFNMGFWEARKLVYQGLKNLFSSTNVSKECDKQINTYAINTLIYTICQIIDTNKSISKTFFDLNVVIYDEELKKILDAEFYSNKKQSVIIKAIKNKKTIFVYFLGLLNNFTVRLREILK